MQELPNIFNSVNVLLGLGATLSFGAVVIAVYNVVSPAINAPGIIRGLNEQYSYDMPLQELRGLYNRLLPASRSIFGKTRRSANEFVETVESRLCEYIEQEWGDSKDLQQSVTFWNTFAQHHYLSKRKPGDAIEYVTGRMYS